METGDIDTDYEILGSLDEKHLFRLKSAIEIKDPKWIALEADAILSSLLKDNITAYKVVKGLKSGNFRISSKEIGRRLSMRPAWRLLIDAHICNIIDRDMFKRIGKLRRKSEEVIKNFNTDAAVRELKKEFYNEWLEVISYLVDKNNMLREEWKKLIMHASKQPS